jgi:hypothetical protein
MIDWISVRDRLPEHEQIVLIHEPNNNVFGYGNVRVRMHVAQFIRGRVPGPGETIRHADQWGNNQVPYIWEGDGPCSWNGQEVTHWAEIDPPSEFPANERNPNLNALGERIHA